MNCSFYRYLAPMQPCGNIPRAHPLAVAQVEHVALVAYKRPLELLQQHVSAVRCKLRIGEIALKLLVLLGYGSELVGMSLNSFYQMAIL